MYSKWKLFNKFWLIRKYYYIWNKEWLFWWNQVEALTKTVFEMKKEIQRLKIKETEKEESAAKFFGKHLF